MSIRRDFPDLPPVWWAGTLAAQTAAAWVVPLVNFGGLWADVLGGAAVILGLGLVVWSAVWFRRKRTSIEPREEPRALIVEGPYRLSRNPIYLGMAVGLFGTGFMLGSLSAIFLAALFPPVITHRFILGEEAALRAAFGLDAKRYLARTRRWFGVSK